jgi:hypothetical protein
LQDLVKRENPSADLVELKGKDRKMISDEFVEQSISARDFPGYSKDEPVEEDEDQEYHQHDLD